MKNIKLMLEKSPYNSEEWHDIKPTGFDVEFKKYCHLIDRECLVQDFLTQHLLINEMLEEKLLFLAERHEYYSKWESAIKLYSEFINDLEIFFREQSEQSSDNEIVQCLNSMILVETTLVKKILGIMRMNLIIPAMKEDLNPPKFRPFIIFFSVIFLLGIVVNFSSELGINTDQFLQLPVFLMLLAAVIARKLFFTHNVMNSTTQVSESKPLCISLSQGVNLLLIQKSTLKNKVKLYQSQCNNTTLLTGESFSI